MIVVLFGAGDSFAFRRCRWGRPAARADLLPRVLIPARRPRRNNRDEGAGQCIQPHARKKQAAVRQELCFEETHCPTGAFCFTATVSLLGTRHSIILIVKYAYAQSSCRASRNRTSCRTCSVRASRSRSIIPNNYNHLHKLRTKSTFSFR